MRSHPMNSLKPTFDPHPRPYYPWVIWLLSVILIFYKFILKAGTYTIVKALVQEHILHLENTSTFVDASFYAVIIFQLPIAFLVDRFGPRRMTSLGLLIAAVGAIIMGVGYFPAFRVIALILMGAGGSIAMINALKLISNWFHPKEFAFMTGLTVMVGILGASIGYPATLKLVEALGWRQSMIDYGIIGILYALLFFLVIRDSEPGARYNINPPTETPLWDAIKKALSKWDNWVIALYFAFIATPWSTFLGIWQVPFLEATHQISKKSAVIINTLSIVGFAIGAPLLGWLSTRLRRRKPFLFIGPLAGLVLILIKIYCPGLPPSFLMIISILSSFFMGVYILAYVVIHEKNLPLITATVIGMILVVAAIVHIINDHLINAAITSSNGSFESADTISYATYAKAFIFIPLSLALSIVCAFFIKETHAKQTFEET